MKKVTVVIVSAFVLAIGAGTLMGVGLTRLNPPPSGHHDPFFELHLTPTQREQMKDIWSNVSRFGTQAPTDAVRSLQKERDEAIAALIPPEHKADYEKALKDFADKRDELNEERKKKVQEARDRMKQILDPEQLKKFEEILAHRGDRPDRGGRGPHPR